MDEELIQKLIEVVTNTAPELWEIAIRQAYLSGVRALVWGFLCLGVGVWDLRYIKKTVDRAKEGEYIGDEDDLTVAAVVILGMVLIIVLIFGLMNISEGFSYLANSKYYAIKLLLDLVK